VGEILEKYNYDQMFPCYGFGAKLPSGQVSHCFALNGSDQVLYSLYSTRHIQFFMSSAPRHNFALLYIYVCSRATALEPFALSSSLTLLRPPWLRPDLYLLYLIKLIQFLVYSSHNLTWLYSCIYMHTDI